MDVGCEQQQVRGVKFWVVRCGAGKMEEEEWERLDDEEEPGGGARLAPLLGKAHSSCGADAHPLKRLWCRAASPAERRPPTSFPPFQEVHL